MRTLVVSDLHLGAGRGRAALEGTDVRRALAEAVAGADRLVLLGDILELRERPLRDALAAASRVLPELVGGLTAGSEVLLLAGNHDHQLVVPFLARRGAAGPPPPLAADEQIGWVAGEPLAELAAMLSGTGATVSARYPGAWLRDDLFVHHGHYLDRHTSTPSFERLAAGGMARLLSAPASRRSGADDYERVLAPIYAWMFAVAQADDGGADAGEREASARVLRWIGRARGPGAYAVEAGVRSLAGLISAAGLGPLSGDLSGRQLRRSALSAYAQVLPALGVVPVYSLFGHTHRAGPLPASATMAADDPAEWLTPAGVRLLNSGSWVADPAFLGAAPYRAGSAIELDDVGPPRLVNLLDAA